MAGLFKHLLDVLPIHAAMAGARAQSGSVWPTGSEVRQYMRPLGPKESAEQPLPPVPKLAWHETETVPVMRGLAEVGAAVLNPALGAAKAVAESDGKFEKFKLPQLWDVSTTVKSQRLWSWKHQAGDLGGISDVHCRVRETGYEAHVALEKLRWGVSEEPYVEVEFESGGPIKLPLETRFLQSKWQVSGGYTPKGGHNLYPLESMQDSGIALVFVYELSGDPHGGPEERRAPREIADRTVEIADSDLYASLRKAWKAKYGTEPSPESLSILMAQWIMETGGKSTHNYNIGNIKTTPNAKGHSWQHFACWEIIHGEKVWFQPPHPQTCFRAYDTLDEGAADYLQFLHDKYAGGWSAIEAGDPLAFVEQLKAKGYFTGNVDNYKAGVRDQSAGFRKRIDKNGNLTPKPGAKAQPERGKLTVHPFAPTGRYTPVDAGMDRMLRELAGAADVGDKNAWLEALSGDFLKYPGDEEAHVAVPGRREVPVSRRRIVVVASFSTFRERADFEPGGLIGMAKVFPHIMVRAGLPLKRFTSTVTFERPSTTKVVGGKTKGNCCGANPDIGALLVADSNDYTSLPQKPFWGGLFAYVATAAQKDATIVGKRIKIVDSSKGQARYDSIGRRHLVNLLVDPVAFLKNLDGVQIKDGLQKVLKKMPRQGEFDNLHLAPTLTLKATHARWAQYQLIPRTTPISSEAMKLDPVYMAPFCSHDCFHTHWRWGANEESEWTKGWDRKSPYKKAGAPMVPLNQDVALELVSGTKAHFHVTATPYREAPGQEPPKGALIPELEWQIAMHHGAAYAQGVADWLQFTGSQINTFLARSGVELLDASGKVLSGASAMYWHLRYYAEQVEGQWVARDRVDFTAGELDRARKL